MRTKNELKEIIRIMADTYYRIFGDAIEQILLYGSYARGDNTVDSDIDLVAIVRGDRQILQNKLNRYGTFHLIWNYNMMLLFRQL